MPFDSNGVFSRVMNWTSDQQNGIAIECGRHDAEDNNFAEGFNETFCRDGRAAATGNFNLGNHKIQNLADGIAATDAVTKGQLDASSAAGVSLNTDQTITGRKTFNDVQVLNGATLKCFNFERGTNPASIQYANLYMTDSTASNGDNTAFGCFRSQVDSNGNVTSLMRAFKNNVAGTNDYADIKVIYPLNGSPYATCPTPTEDTNNSNQIDTVGARNTKLGNYVALTGNQTIAGTKTFSSTIHGSINGNAATVTNGVYTIGSQSITGKKTFTNVPYISMEHPSIHEQKTELTKGTAPTSDQDASGGISFVDKDDKILADVLFGYTTDKETLVALRPHKANASGDTAVSALSIFYPATGNPYTTAPASDVVNSIVTTINKSKAANGYFQLGNGLIVQWGKSTATSSSGSVTLPKAFTTANYAVSINIVMSNVPDTQASNANVVGWGVVGGRTTTSFTAFLCNYENSTWWAQKESGRTFTWIAIGY